MAEEKPSLHIDSDWKKQAQEEKKRLAEQEAQRKTSTTGPAGVVSSGPAAATAPGAARAARGAGAREARQVPPASLQSLIQSIVTQALFYMGELAARGGEPILDLDMARHHIDTLGLLEEKTRGNLTPEESQVLDTALYEVRMRFVNLASQYAQLP